MKYFYYLRQIPAIKSMHYQYGKKVISIEAAQKEAAEQKAAMTIMYALASLNQSRLRRK